MAHSFDYNHGPSLQVIAALELPEPTSWFANEVLAEAWPVVLYFSGAMLTLSIGVMILKSFMGK